MKVHLSWYKSSGKWYSNDVIEMQNIHIWEDSFKQEIVNRQKALIKEWVDDDFYLVVSQPDFELNSKTSFVEHLFMPGAFKGIDPTN